MQKKIIRPSRWQSLVVLSLTLGLVGCTQSTPPTNPSASSADNAATEPSDLPQVVATSSVLCDLTRQIAQETVALTCLMDGEQDPHVYEATPSDRRAIEDADLVLYGGYDYEPDLIQIIAATSTAAPKVAVYEAAVPTPLMGAPHDHDHGEEAHAEGEAHDHDHGDEAHGDEAHEGEAHADEAHEDEAHEGEAAAHDHADDTATVPDPHVWHSAANGAQLVEVIQAELGQIAPDNAALYAQTAGALSDELTALDGWIKTQVATVPAANRKLVTTHEALGYFADAYGFEVKGALSGLSTEEKPTAARMAELVDVVKDAGVPAIFAESTTNPQLIETVARNAEVEVAAQPLYIEGPTGEGTPAANYQNMLVVNTCTIVTELGGECAVESAPIAAK